MTQEGLKAVRMLSKKGIKTNVTLVFSSAQALLAAKAGATYVSPFVGRLDDIGEDGMALSEARGGVGGGVDAEDEAVVGHAGALGALACIGRI